MSGLFPFFCAIMKAQREREAQNMSMEDWDFGYYGKGLDGYVHFRQGIKEIESHAPYSKCRHGRDDSLDDLDDLDEYDDPEDDLFYEPPQKTPVSSAKPVMPSESTTKEADSNTQTVQTSSPEAEPQQETPAARSELCMRRYAQRLDRPPVRPCRQGIRPGTRRRPLPRDVPPSAHGLPCHRAARPAGFRHDQRP